MPFEFDLFYVSHAPGGVGIDGQPIPMEKETDPLVDRHFIVRPGMKFHAMTFEELRELPEGEYVLREDGKLSPKAKP